MAFKCGPRITLLGPSATFSATHRAIFGSAEISDIANIAICLLIWQEHKFQSRHEKYQKIAHRFQHPHELQ